MTGEWPQADFMSIPVSEFERLCQEIRDLKTQLENSIEIVCTGKTSVAILSGDPDAVRAVKLLKQERDEYVRMVEDRLTTLQQERDHWEQRYNDLLESVNSTGHENG
jgi:hypothetical protein